MLVKDAIPLTGGCQNPVEIVEFKNTTWDILRSISENMDKLFRPVGEHYGLTMMQVRILLEIGNSCLLYTSHMLAAMDRYMEQYCVL